MASRGVPETRPASRHARAALAIRTVRVSYFAASRTLARVDPRQADAARRRALELLDDVAASADFDGSAELAALLDETRREISGSEA
jgi:hypothetical protein